MPLKVPKLLSVAHNLAKVDVEHVAAVLDHDVVVVAVADPQDEGGHAPSCTRVDEVLHRLQTAANVSLQKDFYNLIYVVMVHVKDSQPFRSLLGFCSSCGTISPECPLAASHPDPTPAGSSPESQPLEPPPPGLRSTQRGCDSLRRRGHRIY